MQALEGGLRDSVWDMEMRVGGRGEGGDWVGKKEKRRRGEEEEVVTGEEVELRG